MKRLSRNFLAIVLSDLGRRLLGFFTIAYLARRLGPSDFGAINIGFTILSYAGMAAMAGLGTFGARAAARGELGPVAATLTGARFVNSMLMLLVVGCIAFVLPDRSTAALILLFSLSLVPNSFNLEWYFQGKEAMGWIGASRALSAGIYFLLVVTLVRGAGDILLVAVAAVAGDCAASVLLAANYRRRYPDAGLRPRFSGWRSLTLKALPLGAGSLLAHTSANLPPLVIGILMTNADVGIYSAAGKLVAFALVGDRVLGTLLLPATARSFGRSPEALANMLNGALKWMIVAALPVCTGGAILAGSIVRLIFGEQYSAAGEILSVLIWFFLATIVHTVFTSGLIASGQEKLYGKIMVISALLYLCVTVGLTMLAGAVGTAAAMVLSESAAVFMMARALARFVKLELPPAALKAAAASAVMAVALLVLPPAALPVAIAAGAIVYTAVLLATRAISKNEFVELLGRV
jgi:O-antigen/teichoic acid export membrane protein